MDKHDRPIDLIKFLNIDMSELKGFFKPEFATGLTEGGEELSIDDFNHGVVSKFVGLYGLDELFNFLPATLKKIHIKNSNKDQVITIPKTISKFKNLESLYLKNCVSSLPDEICYLKNLVFAAFEDNEKLEQIPESILSLPKLLFINLKGNKNLVLSANFTNNTEQFAPNMWKGKGMLKMEI
jgi:hypothetical protein